MTYVEAITEWDGEGPSIFLAGGITDCPDWQAEAAEMLLTSFKDVNGYPMDLVVLNPRRADFPIEDPSAAGEQIAWEYRHLHRADIVLFWFTAGPSPQPIVQYELGRHAALERKLAVGVEAGYMRGVDVHQQLAHARPDVPVFATLERTCMEAINLLRGAV